MSVTMKGKKCIITINTDFYPREIVEESLKEFKEHNAKFNDKGEVVMEKIKNKEEAYKFYDNLLAKIQEGYSQWP